VYIAAMASKTLLVLTLTAEVIGVGAMWPFTEQVEQPYTAEGMVDVGSLGIEGSGRVVAVGDWDGDQQYVHLLIRADEVVRICLYCLQIQNLFNHIYGTRVSLQRCARS
jgi:hypothetical protein